MPRRIFIDFRKAGDNFIIVKMQNLEREQKSKEVVFEDKSWRPPKPSLRFSSLQAFCRRRPLPPVAKRDPTPEKARSAAMAAVAASPTSERNHLSLSTLCVRVDVLLGFSVDCSVFLVPFWWVVAGDWSFKSFCLDLVKEFALGKV